MKNQTQEVIRQCVQPGMQVWHQGKIWRASANTRGKLYLFSLAEVTSTIARIVEICLNRNGHPLTR